MAKFCTKCGRPLTEGEVCNCTAVNNVNNAPVQQNNNGETISINVNQVASNVSGAWTKLKNKIGLGDPLTNGRNAFEKGSKIVPDCIKPNDNEIPVKQYQVATLQNRILGIPYTKAVGRIQVTNQRVIFRAPGRCLVGRTTLQHEFALDEIAGIEARKEYVFNGWDLIWGLIVTAIGAAAITALITAMCFSGYNNDGAAFATILTLLFGIAGCIPFFTVKKKWLLKLLCLGASCVPMISIGSTVSKIGEYSGSGAYGFFGGLLVFLGILSSILTIFTLIVHATKPNLALIIKTKSASEAIDIRRKKAALLGAVFGGGQSEKDDHTGYAEIWPEEDAELSIHEIGAMINDIQKLGDFGIEKWKK